MCTGAELKMTALTVLFQIAVGAAEEFDREIWWPLMHNGSPWDEPFDGEGAVDHFVRVGLVQ